MKCLTLNRLDKYDGRPRKQTIETYCHLAVEIRLPRVANNQTRHKPKRLGNGFLRLQLKSTDEEILDVREDGADSFDDFVIETGGILEKEAFERKRSDRFSEAFGRDGTESEMSMKK